MSDQELIDLYAGSSGNSINPNHLEGLRRVFQRAHVIGYDTGYQQGLEDAGYDYDE